MSRSSLRAMLGLAPVIVLFALAGGCGQKENKFAPPPPPQVRVSRPLEKAVTDYLELTGNTQAVDQVELQARIEGFLTSIHFKDGDFVKKGDLLFIIEQGQYQAKLEEAQGRLAAAGRSARVRNLSPPISQRPWRSEPTGAASRNRRLSSRLHPD